MKKTLITAVLTLSACIGLLFLMGGLKRFVYQEKTEARVWQHGSGFAESTTGDTRVGSDCPVDGSFSTHLPLLVVDTDDADITGGGFGDSNPYVDMLLYIYDSGSVNSPSDEGVRQIGRIKRRGEGSGKDGKHQFRLTLMDTFGDKVSYPLLGMDAGDEWILDGGDSDGSCLRNYIAYNLASEAGLNSPDVRFCELLLKRGEGYEYMGVYLLLEPVEQGSGRVEFKGKRSLSGAWSYIVKRDGEDSTRPLLETWAYVNGIDVEVANTDRMLTLVYPKNSKATQQAIDYVTDDLSKIEKIIYSDSVLSEVALSKYLDTESFVNYFLINEFTMNRDAGKRSTYMYKDIGGKLTMGPVWGFNDCAGKDQGQKLTMDGMPIFDRLMLNEGFRARLMQRWKTLRQGYLSEAALTSQFESIESYLGNALLRDACRRESFSGEACDSAAEAEKLLSRLLEHAVYMDSELESIG